MSGSTQQRSLVLQGLTTAAWIVALVCASTGLQGQPNPGEGYVGSEACAVCHAENYATQNGSGHAQALFRVAKHPRFQELFAAAEWSRPPDSRFRFKPLSDGVTVTVSHGDRQVTLPVEWAFGSGDQGVTFVSQLENERYLEYSFSWYATIQAMALTAGHPEREPASLAQAVGSIYDVFSVPATITACFQCHSTGPVGLGDGYEIEPAELGVRCEACHGPGREHAAAAKASDAAKAKAAITNPASLPAEKINELCGACHRVPAAEGREFDFSNPWHVRHQPPYLSQSPCFVKSSGALTCFTCHDPHEKLQRAAPQHYNSRCSTCHERAAHPALASGGATPLDPVLASSGATPLDPVLASSGATPLDDCIACHMPKVYPQPQLSFTNHWIGVYEDGPLKPRR